MSAYVYIQSDPGLWTVGFYDPAGRWIPESDCWRNLWRAKLRRLCRTKTVYRLTTDDPDVANTMNQPFTPDVRARLVKEYGDKLDKIWNEHTNEL